MAMFLPDRCARDQTVEVVARDADGVDPDAILSSDQAHVMLPPHRQRYAH